MAVVDDLGQPGMGTPPPSEDYGRQPPAGLMAAEQSVLGGMLLSKDAIADVIEVLRPDDFYRPAHQTVYDAVLDLYGRGEPADAVTVSAELDRRGDADAHRRRAVPAHPDRHRADRGQRRVLRRNRRREGDPAPPGGGRHPDRAARVRRGRGCRRRRRGRPCPGRDLRRHRAAHHRGLRRARGSAAADDGRDRRHRLQRRSRAVCRRDSPNSTRSRTACIPVR